MRTGRIFFLWMLIAGFLHIPSSFAQSIDSVVAFTGQYSLTNYGHVGDQVYLYGNGFAGRTLTSVTFNGVAAAQGQVVADGEILVAHIPAGAATGLVGVGFSGGSPVYSPVQFTVIGTGPYVTGFSPSHASAGTQITITGFGFLNVTNVLFNGVGGVTGRVEADTLLTVYTPPGVTTGPVTVISPSGTFVTSSNFFVPSSITSFSPIAGSAGTNVVIRGTNFIGATGVFFNGLPAASFTVSSPTSINAVVPTGATAGPITITAPGGGFATTTNFTILPTIISFSPAGGPPGTLVVINGQTFGAGAVSVQFNGAASSGVLTNSGGTSLSVYVPNSASTGPITVINSVGAAVSTNLFYLTPSVSTVYPIGGPPGTSVTISGLNLTGVTNVMFGSLSAAFTVLSSNAISATVPNGILTAPVVVSNPGGVSASGPASAVYFYGPPIITSLSTNAGAAGAIVSILGTNLLGTTSVSFGGIPSPKLTVVNNTQLSATLPAGVLTGPVSLSALGGSFSTTTLFYGPPSITGAAPGSGFPGDKITVSGQNLLGTSRVTFGSIIAGYSVLNGNTIQATVPNGISSGAITVATPAGTASSPAQFTEPSTLLTVTALPGGAVMLSWSLALSSWVLQSTPSLGPTVSWANSSATVTVSGNQNVVTIPASGSDQFYRLKR